MKYEYITKDIPADCQWPGATHVLSVEVEGRHFEAGFRTGGGWAHGFEPEEYIKRRLRAAVMQAIEQAIFKD